MRHRPRDLESLVMREKRSRERGETYLTHHQWLDICVAIVRMVQDLHQMELTVNDITPRNYLLLYVYK